ncbi:hypothetical protein [Metabacillus sp. B2-18]|uniref:hypothetical protein n=1 Tax=Metabacillus sp. B2-18 TaxID=2897333 RepID=UPI001E570369|nr:hypothetical protein [Metabacillus sp. B2-18]UGB28743.1 hypothetical protein LPC09_13125 [Metabacillus sp. B2-18]
MAFAFYFFVSWLITFIFVIMPKKLSFMQNSFVFLLILMISINWSWIIYEELKFIKLSTEVMDYTAFIINRSIVIPLTIVITMNLLKISKSFRRSIVVLVLSTSFLSLLALGGMYFNVTKYMNWNFAFDIIYFLLLNIFGYLILIGVNAMEHKEVIN